MKRYEDVRVSEDVSPEAIQSEVERILSSEKFARSKRLRSLLRFTVTQTLQGHADTLKEYVIGTEVLKKPDSYDPRRDSLVRVLASRLRVKLREYYHNSGSEDPLVIEFPKGKYVPRFQRREQLQSEIEKKLRARNAYSLGKFLFRKLTPQSLSESAAHFEEAVDADPSWSAAQSNLAVVYAYQSYLGLRRPREAWPLVRSRAESALQLDEMSSEAHLALGMLYGLYEWRWKEAEAHFQKAIERDTYSGIGHVWRALAYQIPLGRLAAAQEEVSQAEQLAPAPFLEDGVCWALYLMGHFDEVLRRTEHLGDAADDAADVKDKSWFAWLRSCALAAVGRSADGLEVLRSFDPEHPRVVATLGYLYGVSGDQDRARALLHKIQERRERGTWVPYYAQAIIEAGLGNSNEALTALQESLREKEPWMVYLNVEPRLTSLRTSPKFAGLARNVMLNGTDSPPAQHASPEYPAL